MDDNITRIVQAIGRIEVRLGSTIDRSALDNLAEAINSMNGEDSCGSVILVTDENAMVPDIFICHRYHYDFDKRLTDSDYPYTCPYGYDVQLHKRCFSKYTAIELAAAIIHDILQVAMSDICKTRFNRALRHYFDNKSADFINRHCESKNSVEGINGVPCSELYYVAFAAICSRPFRVPVGVEEYVGTDPVLTNMGLNTAYNNYLGKAMPASMYAVETVMEDELSKDNRDVRTVLNCALDGSFDKYLYELYRLNSMPVINEIIADPECENTDPESSRLHTNSLRFTPHNAPTGGNEKAILKPVSEGVDLPFISNKPDPVHMNREYLELLQERDLIVNSIQYAETETDREIALHKVKELRIKVIKTKKKYAIKHSKATSDSDKIEFAKQLECLDSLDNNLMEIRKCIIDREIAPKRWSVYVQTSLPDKYNW